MESTLMLILMAFNASISNELNLTGKAEFTLDEINQLLFTECMNFAKKISKPEVVSEEKQPDDLKFIK